jgi:hypothetical protein
MPSVYGYSSRTGWRRLVLMAPGLEPAQLYREQVASTTLLPEPFWVTLRLVVALASSSQQSPEWGLRPLSGVGETAPKQEYRA